MALELTVGETGTSAEATVSARPPADEASGWAITFSGRPAQVYTTRNALLALLVTNPKTAVKTARIKVKFLNAKGKNKGKTHGRLPLTPARAKGDHHPRAIDGTVRSKAAVRRRRSS